MQIIEMELFTLSTGKPNPEVMQPRFLILQSVDNFVYSLSMEIVGDNLALLLIGEFELVIDRFYVWDWRTGALKAVCTYQISSFCSHANVSIEFRS